MPSDTLTLIIPVLNQPNYLLLLLNALIWHSRTDPRIIIVDSDPERRVGPPGGPGCADFSIGADGKAMTNREYESMTEMLITKKDWLHQHQIEYYDVTEDYNAFYQEFCDGKYGAFRKFQGGTDIAFKNNWALSNLKITSRWVSANFCCDLFPMPEWDSKLIHAVEYYMDQSKEKAIATPTHIQSEMYFPDLPQWSDVWTQSRERAHNRLAIPMKQSFDDHTPNTRIFAYKDLLDYYNRHKKDETIIIEKAHATWDLHFQPTFYRTQELFDNIGLYSYMGSGYDVEIGTRCGEKGYKRVSSCGSWVYHKCFAFFDEEDQI